MKRLNRNETNQQVVNTTIQQIQRIADTTEAGNTVIRSNQGAEAVVVSPTAVDNAISVGGGLQIGVPTDGDMGPGTLNVEGGLYINGVAVAQEEPTPAVHGSNLTDNSIIRGDGGDVNVQASALSIDDSGNLASTQSTMAVSLLGLPNVLRLGAGIQIGSPTGGYLGAGTLNVDSGIYIDGVSVTTTTNADPCIYRVSDYGATCDGTTDDSAAIQNAIDAAVANNGGIVLFDQKCSGTNFYAVTQVLGVHEPGVVLQGYGAYDQASGSSPTQPRLTLIKRTSGTGNPFITFDHDNDPNFSGMARNGMVGIALDGNGVVADGLYIKSQLYGRFEDLHIKGMTSTSLWTDCTTSSGQLARGFADTQKNLFSRITVECGTGTGFFLGGAGTGNTSFNTFMDCHVDGGGAGCVGYYLDAADNNMFINCGGWTGAGETFHIASKSQDVAGGWSDANYFMGCYWTAFHIAGTEVGAGSTAPVANIIFTSTYGGEAPSPTTGTGARYIQIPAKYTTYGSWTPTFASSSGTITSAAVQSATYKLDSDSVYFTVQILITTVGTASGTLDITMPKAAADNFAFGGMHISASHPMTGYIQTTSNLAHFIDGTTGAFPVAGYVNVSGFYKY